MSAGILSSRLLPRSFAIVGLLLFAVLCLPDGVSQLAAQEEAGPPEIEFSLPEGSSDFGSEEFAAPDATISTEEAAAATMMFAIGSAICSSVPALILGLVIGYFVGKRKST